MIDFQLIIDFIRSLYPGREVIPLHEPFFGGNEKKYVTDCIDSTFVSSVGEYVNRFEDMVKEFTGAQYAIATVNGTAALHVALKLAGVQPGDLVITQPLTFVATCNAISYCNADPLFIDIDKQTLGLSAAALEEWLAENAVVEGLESLEGLGGLEGLDVNCISSQLPKMSKLSQPSQQSHPNRGCIHKQTRRRISACLPMHTFGHPCEIEQIAKICDQYGIPLVEDAAESIGSYYRGRHTGTFGLLGTLSFNGNKTITTGGGGMILTNDPDLGKLAKHITTTAKKPHPWNYEHDMIGYNYRLPNLNAALGCAQMEILPALLQNKRHTAGEYMQFFDQYSEIDFIPEPDNSTSNYWLNSILLPDPETRDAFLKTTNQNGVITRPAWKLMNQLEMFTNCLRTDLENCLEISSKLVNLPSSYRISLQ